MDQVIRLFFKQCALPLFIVSHLSGMDKPLHLIDLHSTVSSAYQLASQIPKPNKEKRELLAKIVSTDGDQPLLSAQKDQILAIKSQAAFDIGCQYEKGWEDEKASYEKAALYYERALGFTKHVKAACRLAKLYARGDGVSLDREKAKKILKGIVDPAAIFLLGEINEQDDLIDQAIVCYDVVHLTNGKAAFCLGQLAERGLLPQNSMSAQYYFYKAATLGNRDAIVKLAPCVQANHPNNVIIQRLFGSFCEGYLAPPVGTVFAAGWYEKAAQAGDVNAMVDLACVYARGSLAEKNSDKAIEWLGKAMQRGNERVFSEVFNELKKRAETNAHAQVALAKIFESPGRYYSLESANHYYSLAKANGHPEGYYWMAQVQRATPIAHFKCAGDVHAYYNDLQALYADAASKGHVRAKDELERVCIVKKAIDHLRPEFNNFLFEKLKNLRAFVMCNPEPELLLWAAYCIELSLSRYNETIQGAVVEAIIAVLKFNRDGHLARCVLRRIIDLLESRSFSKNPRSEGADDFRIQELMKIFGGIKLLMPREPIFLTNRDCSLRRTAAGTEDLRIEVFNSLFTIEAPEEQVYKDAVEELIALFNAFIADGTIAPQNLKDDELRKSGDEKTLRQLLTFYQTSRYKQRIIKIASLMRKLDVPTQRAQLASWAVAGIHCSIRAEQETYNFYVRTMTDINQVDKEHLGLDMRIALCLAELRKKCFALLISSEIREPLHQIAYLERRLGKKMALIGDPNNSTDAWEQISVLPEFKRMTDEKIEETVLLQYQIEAMVNCIRNEANKRTDSRLSVEKILEYFEITLRLGTVRTMELMNQLYDEDRIFMTDWGAKVLLHHFGYLECA